MPWLCAYSGARLSKICQLRREDVPAVEGIWCLTFDPEVGSLETRSSERLVPLHPSVLDSGCPQFAETVKTGPPFADLAPDTFGKRGGNGTKILGRWVRSRGPTDGRLSPGHRELVDSVKIRGLVVRRLAGRCPLPRARSDRSRATC